jgi:oxygen-independent coproporphyrinogen-3 oxidase
MLTLNKQLIQKYDIPGPRYTSYPTAPVWSNQVTEDIYIQKLRQFGASAKTLSLYLHIPFCRTMCSFCACNVIIRKPEEKYGDEYLAHLFKEMDLVSGYIGSKPKIKQLHWGGGTPTFLTENQIIRLHEKINRLFNIDSTAEIAIEIDPRTIDHSKLKTLRRLGFNRLSMGVQDFNELVQKSVNRLQPFECVEQFNQWARDLKFDSVNFDLIYGLPNQTKKSFEETIEKVIMLKPERIALYSFAYVPWLKKHQQKIDTAELPNTDDKMDIFLHARGRLIEEGYLGIAMDHFALESDELAKAFNSGNLYRNFMGYTVKPADEFIGMGLTSIGFVENTFVQNYKTINDYYSLLHVNKLPIERGKILTEDDRIRQWVINSFMCQFKMNKNDFKHLFSKDFDHYFKEDQPHIEECKSQGLLQEENYVISVTELGKLFIRNICMGFDFYLRQENAHKRFSRTV